MKTDPHCPINGVPNEGLMYSGLTKLEWFAGIAMQGLMNSDYDFDDIPKQAVAVSMALISELNK